MPLKITSLEAVATIGIDIGKNTFHLIGMTHRGRIVLRRRVSRDQLERNLVNLPRCLIGLEACAGAHHVARKLSQLGHDVRLIPARYVKPFIKGRVLCCSVRGAGQDMASADGSRQHPADYTVMFLPWRWPTSSPASPGVYFTVKATTNQTPGCTPCDPGWLRPRQKFRSSSPRSARWIEMDGKTVSPAHP